WRCTRVRRFASFEVGRRRRRRNDRARSNGRGTSADDRRSTADVPWSATLVELLELLPHDRRRQRQVLAVALHLRLAFLAQDVAEELLHVRFERRPGLHARIEIGFLEQRIGAVLHRLQCVLDEGPAVGRGHCQPPDVRPRAQSGRKLVPAQPPSRAAPNTPSSCSRVMPLRGFSLLTRITVEFSQPATSYEPVTAVISSGSKPITRWYASRS